MIFFNLVSAITTEYAVYVLARFGYKSTEFANMVDLLITSTSFHQCHRFLVGFFVAGNILSIVVLMSEIVGASW